MHINETNLLKVLTLDDVQYFAPPFQRRYCWEERNWQAFWEDLTAAKEQTKAHFTGVVALLKSSSQSKDIGKYLIIDGQQRLTTAYLLLLAARALYPELPSGGISVIEAERKSKIFSDLFNQYAEDDSEDIYRLRPTLEDFSILRELVSTDGQRSSAQEKTAIVKAYRFLKAKLQKEALTKTDLVELIRFGLGGMYILELHFNENDDACAAFSDINGKGQQLTGVDLIKNFLLMEVQRSQPGMHLDTAYDQVWAPLLRIIPEKKLEDFFHAFLYLNHGGVQKSQIYSELVKHFKEYIKHGTLAEYIELLSRTALAFRDVYSKAGVFAAEGPRLAAFSSQMTPITGIGGAVLTLSLVLAYNSGRISRKHLDECVSMVERALLRYFFYGETNNVAKAVGSYAHKLQDKKGAQFVDELRKNLKAKLYPDDNAFKTKLLSLSAKGWSGKMPTAVRYALWLLEASRSSSPPPIVEFAVEHIWPMAWQKTEWETHYSGGSDISPLVGCLGNFTLIRPKLNAALRNMGPQTKLPALASSGILINQQYFPSVTTWTKEEIESRRQWLVDELVNSVIADF